MRGGWRRPTPVRPGDLVVVCAPSGAVDLGFLEKGVAALRGLGFRVRLSDGVGDRRRFMAGSVERRVADLHAAFADPEVRGVFCARGGAGAGWLLPHLDAKLLAASDKAFVGYSDLTYIHLFLNGLGLSTFYGPMVAPDFGAGRVEAASFLRAVGGVGEPYSTPEDDIVPLRPGVAEGRLLGGCLTILAAACGTPWPLRPDPAGTVLFFEDVDEPPYRIDRMILQLRSAGCLDGVVGIVFGDMKGCAASSRASFSLEDVVLDALHGLDIPVALGLSSGHSAGPSVTLPLGERCRLTCGDGAARFEILEGDVE